MTAKRTSQPTSARQSAANRANAAKSTGPTSDAGKATASANALQHGLYAERAVAIPRGLLAEDPQQVTDFVDQCVTDLEPQGPIQELVARQIAVALLRVLRFETYEALQLARAGRLPATAGDMVSPAGEDDLLAADIDALNRFQEWAGDGGVGDLTGVENDHLLGLLPAGSEGRAPHMARSSATTEPTADRLRRLVEAVWAGDWVTARKWAEAATSPLLHRRDQIGQGREVAAARAGEEYLNALTVVYSRLDSSLDRALARYAELRKPPDAG
jgi:hypothetical protein